MPLVLFLSKMVGGSKDVGVVILFVVAQFFGDKLSGFFDNISPNAVFSEAQFIVFVKND